jgi:hypothetical protein
VRLPSVIENLGIISLPIPGRMVDLVSTWDEGGRPDQPGIVWRRSMWVSAVAGFDALLPGLPSPLDRSTVRSLCEDATVSPEGAKRAFVATMVWGYGRVGYGPFRTARVFDENDEAGQILQEVASLVRSHGGPTAFEWFARHRLRGLGVAFATKYLHFCADPEGAEPALILDRLVRSWLGTNTGWYPRLDWRPVDYRRYVDTVLDWANTLDLSPADVEYLMFASEASSDRMSQWGQTIFASLPSTPDRTTRATEDTEVVPISDESVVLAALSEAADLFSELSDITAADSDDFERGVRQLRRIVLSRRVQGSGAS